jgi:hypothetical protein
MMTKLNVWAVLVSIGHVTLVKESSFGAETRLITQNLKPEKGCDRETIIPLQQRKWKHCRQ